MKLVFPTLEHRQAALDYRQEHFDCGERIIHGDAGLDEAGDYENWVKVITEDLTRADDQLVPATVYFVVQDDRIVGMTQIRHQLNDYLFERGGHIGYGVRPSERGKGYATGILALALEECRTLGIDRVLVTCDKSNTGSARTILRNCGVLEDEVTDKDGSVIQRYWITL